MAGYVSLPAYQVPRNAMLDFSGLNAGIDAIAERNQNAMNRAERAEERTYQRGRNAVADSREQTRFNNQQDDRARNNFDDTVKRVAGFAQDHVLSEKDPARRAAKWQQLLDSHPDLKGAPDAYRDPTSGPELFVSQARGYMDPLERQLKEAQISKMQRETAESSAKFGKTGTTVMGPDGNYYSVRYANDGTEQINPLELPNAPAAPGNGAQPVPLTPSRGVKEVDTGTGTQVIDGATGLPVRNVPKDIAGAEAAKVEGKNNAEIKASMPKARASLRALETQHRNVIATMERALPMIDGWTTGLAGQGLSKLGGTDANNLRVMLNTVKANMGFDKLQDMRDNSPTGGALGQVAIAELEMLQSAFASVEQSQTPQQLRENMTYLMGLLNEMQDNRRMAFDETYGAANRPQASPEATKSYNWTPDGGLQEAK